MHSSERMHGMNVREEVEWFSASNLPLKRVKAGGMRSMDRGLDDYSVIPSYREVMEVNQLTGLEAGQVSADLGQPLPMRDIIKESQRRRWLGTESFQPLPRLLERPELPSARNLVHVVFVNYVILVIVSGIGVAFLSYYVGLEHTHQTNANHFSTHVAPIYFAIGILTVLVAGKYLLKFYYDFTPYGVNMRHLVTLREMCDDSFQ